MKKFNEIGVCFACISLLISIFAFLTINWPDYFSGAEEALLILGGIVPLLTGLFGKELAGCSFKEDGCIVGLSIGFFVGSIALILIYYFIGVLLSKLIKS